MEQFDGNRGLVLSSRHFESITLQTSMAPGGMDAPGSYLERLINLTLSKSDNPTEFVMAIRFYPFSNPYSAILYSSAQSVEL